MPADYEAIKAKLMKGGKSKKDAEAEAAAIHNKNAKPGEGIVTSAGEGYKKKKPGSAHSRHAKKLYPSHPSDE